MFLESGTRHSLGSLPNRKGEGLEISNQAVTTPGAHGQVGLFKVRAGGSVRREESSPSAAVTPSLPEEGRQEAEEARVRCQRQFSFLSLYHPILRHAPPCLGCGNDVGRQDPCCCSDLKVFLTFLNAPNVGTTLLLALSPREPSGLFGGWKTCMGKSS